MEQMPYEPPTTHYDERIIKIDEKICELIRERSNLSDNNPGYPPFKYITKWAEKFGFYEDFLKSLFGALFHEKDYKPRIIPEVFQKNIPIVKYVEKDNRIYSILCLRQYSNCSIVDLNIDWYRNDDSEDKQIYKHFKVVLTPEYQVQDECGSGSRDHFTHKFLIYPALPDNIKNFDFVFKEYNRKNSTEPTGLEIVIHI